MAMTPQPSPVEPQPTTLLTKSISTLPAEGFAGEERGGAKAKLPRQLLGLFLWIPFVSLVPYLAFGLTTFFAAVQAQEIDPDGKVAALAMISGVSAFAAMLAQPVIGLLSDRTRGRFGSRRPWILFGALLGAIAMITAGLSTSIAMLTIAVTLVQFGFNAMQAPLSAILPDRVPHRFRGRYSTLAGLGVLLGSVIGTVIGGVLATSISAGYASVAGALLLITVLFVLTVRGSGNKGEPRAPFSLAAFLKAFWVNPIRHPDFFWGFMGRFALFGGYSLINTYLFYIVQDYIGLPQEEALALVPILSVLTLPGIILAASISGPLSDRVGRRKPFVLVAGLLITAGAVIPIIFPTVPGVIASMLTVAIGFGIFQSVDQALMSSVLPSSDRFGTDLGVLNIAATLPAVIGPAMAGVIILTFGGYLALYAAVAIIALIGALAVLPIKSVK
jgi:MFS family permease